jgi:hypothetical protein
MARFGLGLVLAALLTTSLAAQDLAPGTRYDPSIPTSKAVLGHDFGDEITPPEGITAYMRALAAAAPDRTRLLEYARTWEGRPLHVLVIGSPERIARLDEIKGSLRRLADPRAQGGDTGSLIAGLPVVVWLMHAVHGNEISSSDAALAEAYHLLAAEGDAAVDRIRREALVLIDPLQNPDGRARFVSQNLLGRAAKPDADPLSAEHDEPWPGGRSNHYLFDMNRDWFSQSQPETLGRLRLALEWFPQVVVDLHEMGGDSTYYFAPPADPLNPYITKQQASWFDVFGRANAARFDERGFAYFIREEYDSFYPGYGESWPIFNGAIGMTYEQASPRGLLYRREDGSLLSYREGVVHHFTAAVTTLATAAANREKLLRDFAEYRQSAIAEGEKGTRAYLIPPGGDPARAARLARLLVTQGIEVGRATEPLTIGSRELPAGTFVVAAAQPTGRLVRNLLEPQVAQPEAFVAEQDRRRRKRLGDQFYDVTGWSLPHLFDVEVVAAEKLPRVPVTPLAGETPQTAAAIPAAKVAYLLPWGSGTASLVVEALQAGLKVRQASQPFTIGGRQYPGGTAIVRLSDNPADLPAKIAALAGRHEAEVVPLDSGWVEQGISLGSNQVRPLKAPRVLLAWDAPTRSLSAGWARYVLERRFGQPATAVRVSSFGEVDLRRFDVVVLPQGNYTPALGEDAIARLREWMKAGGTLVTIGEASRWAANEKVSLLATHTELRDGSPDVEPSEKDKKPPEPVKPFDLEKAVQPPRERPESTPGAVLRVALDREHWLTAGLDGEVQAIVEGTRVFTPLTLDKGTNVGVYLAADRLVAGGLVWDEARDQLARKAFLMAQPVGQGHLVAFAEDPNYRAFSEATELLFINAVVLGPGY